MPKEKSQQEIIEGRLTSQKKKFTTCHNILKELHTKVNEERDKKTGYNKTNFLFRLIEDYELTFGRIIANCYILEEKLNKIVNNLPLPDKKHFNKPGELSCSNTRVQH